MAVPADVATGWLRVIAVHTRPRNALDSPVRRHFLTGRGGNALRGIARTPSMIRVGIHRLGVLETKKEGERQCEDRGDAASMARRMSAGW